MEISVEEEVVRISVGTPSGSIDAFKAPQLRDKIDGLLNDGVRHIGFDLSGASFLDSAGLAVLVSWIRGDPAYTDLPDVMLTASGQGKDEAIAMEQRVSLFLTKPFGSRDLRSKISGLLGG